MDVGNKVRHKKDKTLIAGTVREISKSGLRARVFWDKKDNPRLVWGISAYYRLDLLENTESTESPKPKEAIK